jgi:hypothetical protein
MRNKLCMLLQNASRKKTLGPKRTTLVLLQTCKSRSSRCWSYCTNTGSSPILWCTYSYTNIGALVYVALSRNKKPSSLMLGLWRWNTVLSEIRWSAIEASCTLIGSHIDENKPQRQEHWLETVNFCDSYNIHIDLEEPSLVSPSTPWLLRVQSDIVLSSSISFESCTDDKDD